MELGENEVTHSEEMGNNDYFLKGTKKKKFEESLIIMVRVLRVAKPFLMALVVLCSFILAESLAGYMERPCVLCQGIKTSCSPGWLGRVALIPSPDQALLYISWPQVWDLGQCQLNW